VVRVLVNVKAKQDKVDMNGTSPLSIAASPNHFGVVLFLVNVKAKLDKFDRNGTSP